MATWAVQQTGNFATTSDNAGSPWYDGGAQTALASIPQPGDTITNAGAFSLTFDIDIPAVASVLDSDTVYGAAGSYHAPDAAEVIDTAVFGPASSTSGTWHVPDAAEVIDSAVFGPSSSIAGTFSEEDRNTDPGAASVLYGVTYKIHNVAKVGTNVTSTSIGGGISQVAGKIEMGRVIGKSA